jgi:nickel/cobalt transporter (NiCoT) family protein
MASRPAGPGDLRLTVGEKSRMVLLYVVVVGVTLGGFYASYLIGLRWTVLAGLGLVAYILGLRHGFDADHIAAIDNTTRKLLHDGKRPLTVGTWFSLGHSTIVCGLIVALILVTDFIKSHIAAFQQVGTILGTAVSGVFLFLIGLVNLLIVAEVYRMFQRAKSGRLDEEQYEAQMNQRGFLYRYFYRFFRAVKEPWQIYPIGVLFGLGFDTATEVALIAISVGAGVSGVVPIWTVLVLPLLFTCGMVLSDTSDGFAMRYAYGWAFNNPIRKIFYNLTLTVISVLVAFAVGGVELLQVLSTELGLTGPFWNQLGALDFETIGYVIVILFVGSWSVAMLIYRWKGYERLGFAGGGSPLPSAEGDSAPLVPGP